MNRLTLMPHPTAVETRLTLQAECRRRPGALSLEYRLGGAVEGVRWPDPAPRQRTDDLWRTTCFEVFAAMADGYVEYNLSPSGAWAAYRFDGYRRGRRLLDVSAPSVMMRHAPGLAILTVDVPLPDDAIRRVGLSAVVEAIDGGLTYWALAHPSDKPDFHHPDSFVLDLPAPEPS